MLYQLSYTPIYQIRLFWWTVRDSNPGPTGYEPAALPTALTVRMAALRERESRHKMWRPSIGSPSRTRTYDTAVNSRVLYRLSY